MVLGKKVRKTYSFDRVPHVRTLARVKTKPDVGEKETKGESGRRS